MDADSERFRRLAAGRAAGRPGDGVGVKSKGSKDKTDELFKADLQKSNEIAEKELERLRHLGAQLQNTYDENRASVEEFYKGRETLATSRFDSLIDQINREQDALDQARARGTLKTAEADKKDAELTQRTTKAQHDLSEEQRKIKIDRQRALDKAELDLNTQLLAVSEAQRQLELARIERALEHREIAESDALKKRLEIAKQAHVERQALLELELKQQSTTAARKTQIDNEILKNEISNTEKVEDLVQRRIDARAKENAELTPAIGGGRGVPDLGGNVLTPEELEAMGKPPDFTLWDIALDEIEKRLTSFHNFAVTSIENTVEGIEDAFKSATQAWLLYNQSFGEALKQGLAQVAASIAAEALFQSVLHAAYALGSLAFGDFKGAAQHGIAAAKFAAVAAIAGLGAKALSTSAQNAAAGKSFAGESTNGSSASNAPNNKPQPIDIDRNSLAPIVVNNNIVLGGQLTEGFQLWVEKQQRQVIGKADRCGTLSITQWET